MYPHILARVRGKVHREGYAAGRRWLLTQNNNRPEPERCRGRLTDYGGVPALAYCRSWTCWLHAGERLWREGRRALLGALWVLDQGLPLYWIRVSLVGNDGDPMVQWKKLRTSWSTAAKAAGYDLHLYGLGLPMPSNGAWHAHILASWLPSPEPDPTPKRQFRLRDQDFQRWCDNAGLRCHLEVVGSVDAVVGYLVKNGREAVKAKVWPDVLKSGSWVHEKLPARGVLVRDALDRLHGEIYAADRDGEILRNDAGSYVDIPRSLVARWLQKGYDAVVWGWLGSSTSTYRDKKDTNGKKLPGDGDHPEPVPEQLPLRLVMIWRVSQFRRCTRCHQVLPVGEFHRSGKYGRRPDCRRCCSVYNRLRRPVWRRGRSGGPGGGRMLPGWKS